LNAHRNQTKKVSNTNPAYFALHDVEMQDLSQKSKILTAITSIFKFQKKVQNSEIQHLLLKKFRKFQIFFYDQIPIGCVQLVLRGHWSSLHSIEMAADNVISSFGWISTLFLGSKKMIAHNSAMERF